MDTAILEALIKEQSATIARLMEVIDAKDAELAKVREELAMVRWVASLQERLRAIPPITNQIQ